MTHIVSAKSLHGDVTGHTGCKSTRETVIECVIVKSAQSNKHIPSEPNSKFQDITLNETKSVLETRFHLRHGLIKHFAEAAHFKSTRI